MTRTPVSSPQAAAALALLTGLQRTFVERLEALSRAQGAEVPFTPIEWLRDGGRHGGGERYACVETSVFNRASVNVSAVHYDDEPERKLASAVALSTIIHPRHPRAPSVHLHLSFTQPREGQGTWRLMADLNPSHDDPGERERFEQALHRAAPELLAGARAEGDRYFYIPALARHRGITHFYVEAFASGDFPRDLGLAERLGLAVIDTYAGILGDALARHPEPFEGERAAQLAYHTLYFFQVLTLDRGTTAGLLVHDQNDVGVLGSLPAWVDRGLLSSWVQRLPAPQDELLRGLVAALPEGQPAHVTDDVRQALAQVVRGHYRAHPEAVALQARQ